MERAPLTQHPESRPDGARVRPPLDARELASIFAGGFLGAILRASLTQALPSASAHWPWVTFAVNICGAAVLGAISVRYAHSRYRSALLGTGFCGALTTFSTMMSQLLLMVEAGRWALAAGYAAASVLGGLAAVMLAIRLMRRLGAAR